MSFLKKIFNKKYLGLLVAVIFLAIILENMDLNKTFDAIKNFKVYYLAIIIPIYILSFAFRALRWQAILANTKPVKFFILLDALFRGWFMNNIIPARGGEIYRAHYFGKKENISRVTIFTSIVFERIFDGLFLFLVLFFTSTFIYSSEKFSSASIAAGLIFSGIFTGLLLVFKFYNHDAFAYKCSVVFSQIQQKNTLKKIFNEKLCGILSKIFDKTSYIISSFISGLEIFHSPKLILKAFLITIPVWICEGLAIFFLLKGFGCSVGILGAMFVLSVIAFISLIPGGPAGLGPVQWGYIISLAVFDIPKETAFAASLAGQLFAVMTISLGFLFFIMHDNFKQADKKLEI